MSRSTGYSIYGYGEMAASEPRIASYVRALEQAVFPGCAVVDIGSGFGIFALIAAKLGAGSVIAIEPDASAELIMPLAAANGVADRITVVRDISTQYQPDSKADVVVSDLRGALPHFEHHLSTIVDARERLLKPGGVQIPGRDLLKIALVSSSRTYRWYRRPYTSSFYGVDLRSIRNFALSQQMKVFLKRSELASAPADLAAVDYRLSESENLKATASMVVSRPSTVHGFAVWFDAELLENIGFSNAPGERRLVYGQTFFPFERPQRLTAGDIVQVHLRADLINGAYIYTWRSKFSSARNASDAIASYEQSTFRSKVLPARELSQRSEECRPRKKADFEIISRLLSGVDGEASYADLAAAIRAEFPGRFQTGKSALDFVVRTVRRYSDISR